MRIQQGLHPELGFLFSAFSTGMNVLMFLRGLPGMAQAASSVLLRKGFEGNEETALCLMWGILSSLLKYAVLQCCCREEKNCLRTAARPLGNRGCLDCLLIHEIVKCVRCGVGSLCRAGVGACVLILGLCRAGWSE